jgi:cytosine/uracil/thiamine/allantoin permease
MRTAHSITAGSTLAFGEAISDPGALVQQFDYTWFLGLAVSAVAYAALMRSERSEVAPEPALEIVEELR